MEVGMSEDFETNDEFNRIVREAQEKEAKRKEEAIKKMRETAIVNRDFKMTEEIKKRMMA